MKTKLLILILMTFASTNLLARGRQCKLVGNDILYHNGNVEANMQYPYRIEAPLRTTQIPGTRVFDCLKAAQKRKWLFVGFGTQERGFDVNDEKVFFDNELQPNFCEPKGTSFPIKSFEERKKDFEARNHFNNTCLKRRVHHVSSQPLVIKEGTPDCKVTKINAREAYIEGGICFFRIFPDSDFVFSYEINQSCLDKNFLIQNKIQPQEVKSFTTYNVVGDTSGSTNDFELLGSRLVHARIDPLSQMGDLTDSTGIKYPTYFSNYNIPEHDISKILVEHSEDDDNSYIQASMIVNNVCKENEKFCQDGLCTSLCNYQRPFVAEFTLSKMVPGKRKPQYISNWYEGGVAPPNWQGALSTKNRELKGIKFKKGEKYQVKVRFRDPKNDFLMISRGMNPLFRTIPGFESGSFSQALNDGVPTIGDLTALTEIPTFDSLDDIDSTRSIDGLDAGMTYLTKNSMWPPYYRDVCTARGGRNCTSNGRRAWLEYDITFELGDKVDEWSDEFQLKNIQLEQKSKLLGNKSRRINKFPELVCPE